MVRRRPPADEPPTAATRRTPHRATRRSPGRSIPCSTRASWSPERRPIPASSASCRSQHPGERYTAGVATNLEEPRCSASTPPKRRGASRGCSRPRHRVHPQEREPDLLRACAAKGIRAASYVAGYGEAGEQGQADEHELVALCDELASSWPPQRAGVVSTPATSAPRSCAVPTAGPSGSPASRATSCRRSSTWRPRPASASAARVGRECRCDHSERLPRLLRDRRRNRRGLAYVEASTTAVVL